MTPRPATTPRAIWIVRPWVDLLIGCGGWSLPLLALSYWLTGDAARQWSAAFYTLALVANYPHYMATVYRAYGRADRSAHRLYTVYGTAGLVALGAIAHAQLWLVPLLFTAYVMWSPWHYTGQNFGLLLMFLRRGGLEVTAMERRRVKVAFVASYLMLLAAFNAGVSTDPLVLSAGLPLDATRLIAGAAGFTFVVVGMSAFASLSRRAAWSTLKAPLLLLVTQGLWFVVPTAFTIFSTLAVPQTRYSSGALALMHSAQYLWITAYFAKREQGSSWVAARYWGAVTVGGMALFLPVPWLASYVGHIDFTASMFIVASIVNLHHFMLDGVVWKLRNERVSKTLGAADGAAPVPPDSSVTVTQPAPALGRVALAAVALVLIGLAGLDQWRYRLVSRDTDQTSLEAALGLNPYDTGAQMRLLSLRVANGRTDEARMQIEQLLQTRPRDVDLLVNAGVLAQRTGRKDDAARYWSDALVQSPNQPLVHLYLAELLDERGHTDQAIDHYRRYLELTVEQRDRQPPDANLVIPIVLKFADALSRTGHPSEARAQFELAVKMAQQTSLTELERLAREGLAKAQ